MKNSHATLEAIENNRATETDIPYIVAETACAHDGDPDTLQRLIAEVEPVQPDAIQVEIFSPDHQVRPDDRMYDGIQELAFSWETWDEILEQLSEMDIDTFVFAYDVPSLEFALNADIDAIKLSSADLVNPEMVSRAAEADVPTTLSTGGCTFEEIARALDQYTQIADAGPILMHGIQNFPTALENAWLNRIELLRETFGLPVGYQDHTDGRMKLSKYIDLLALGVGAVVLEKHVTLSRAETETDFEAALEPDEFAEYTETVRTASEALGSKTFRTDTESEREYQKFQKKKVVTTEPIEAGDRVRREGVAFLRTTSSLEGMSPRKFTNLDGVTATCNLPASTPITPSDIDTDA
jgi:sialic acid synthase SpsE